jgi:large subunit ribosomal protein L22
MEKEVRAKLNHLRIAPRKVRLAADMIRGKGASYALTILKYTPKRAALPLEKLLKSAIANAKNNFQLGEDNLYISKLTVDEGPKLKRWRARAMGRAFEIQKKTSHITLVLAEREVKTKKDKIKSKTRSKKLKAKNKK